MGLLPDFGFGRAAEYSPFDYMGEIRDRLGEIVQAEMGVEWAAKFSLPPAYGEARRAPAAELGHAAVPPAATSAEHPAPSANPDADAARAELNRIYQEHPSHG